MLSFFIFVTMYIQFILFLEPYVEYGQLLSSTFQLQKQLLKA